MAAVERGRRGIYNVVDDEPAPGGGLAAGAGRAIGAKPPMRVPAGWVRLLAGEAVCNDDRGPRRLERQGQARARLASRGTWSVARAFAEGAASE